MKKIIILIITFFVFSAVNAQTKKITGSYRFTGHVYAKDSISTLGYYYMLKYKGYKFHGDYDTLGVILYSQTGKIDTAMLVFAAKGWVVPIDPYWRFYQTSKKLHALPFPYPEIAGGKDRRQLNALYRDYQIEFELERIHRYLKRNWNADQIRTTWLVILTIFVIHQRFKINKLKKQQLQINKK